MRKIFSQGMIAFAAGIVCAPVASSPADSHIPPSFTSPTDSRVHLIRNFFLSYAAPASQYAAVFVAEADHHSLDWRLLPSLAMAETSGGKGTTRNNLFGWNCGKASFPSISQGIHTVAQSLAELPQYRSKAVPELLKSYNPKPDYAGKIMSWMRKIAPSATLAD